MVLNTDFVQQTSRSFSGFEQKDTWQASTYPQSEIVTIGELVVTNSLEVDCLQIEHELHCHQSATELQVSLAQGKCTNTQHRRCSFLLTWGNPEWNSNCAFPLLCCLMKSLAQCTSSLEWIRTHNNISRIIRFFNCNLPVPLPRLLWAVGYTRQDSMLEWGVIWEANWQIHWLPWTPAKLFIMNSQGTLLKISPKYLY